MTGSVIRRRRRPEVNIVPLVDVLMVLIFFFMMTMQFREERYLNIVLPEIETAGENRPSRELLIAIDKEGTIFINNRESELEELEAALEVQARLQPERPVLIVADEEAPLRFVTAVIDRCRLAGLYDFKLQSR